MMLPDMLLHKDPSLLMEGSITKREAKVFSIVDRIVELLDGYADTFAIVSDHGFAVYDKVVSVNQVLYEHGLASIASPRQRTAVKEHHELRRKSPWKIELGIPYKLLEVVSRYRFLAWLAKKIYKPIFRRKLVRVQAPAVDVEKSLAFLSSHYSFGVYVRSKEVLDEVLRLLNSLEGIKWAKRREDIFWGPYVKRAPHVMLHPEFDKGYNIGSNKLYGKRISFRVHADHHPLGVLIFRSETLDVVEWPRKLPNYVVAPLVMASMGVPIPRDSDAKPLLERILGGSVSCSGGYTERWRLFKKVRQEIGLPKRMLNKE